ncbi:MAG TPA: glycosyltransferase family 2 protein [Candidatus Saccharimonadales bacterium]|nr:glycosyltransferase family 2 protein [Candidatus Saccharimonadales bacterium]
MSRFYPPSTLLKASVMNKRQRIFFGILMAIGVLLTSIFGIWWFEPSHIAANYHGWKHAFDFVLFGVVSYVIWHQLVSEAFSWTVVKDMKHPYYMKPKPGMRVAFLTAFVPGKEPYEMLENTLKAMVAVDYEHDTWLLDEGNDRKAKEICKRLGVHHFSRKNNPEYNLPYGPYMAKTKGGNHNAWHDRHGDDYDFVAQMDIDFIPRKDFLTLTLGYFKDPKVAFVGTPQIYGNTEESWIAQGAAEQAYGFYGNLQKGYFGKDMQLLIGANHVIRVAALKEIGGYSGHIVEDLLTGMNIYTKRWKSVYVPEKLAIGEGPATWDAYFSQQMRWAYGLIDVLFKHSPRLLPKMKFRHAINYLLLQQHYFYGLIQLLGVVLLTLFFMFGIQSTSMALIPMLILYIPLLVWQMLITIWLQKFYIDPKNESGAMIKGKLVTLAAWPIYFLAFLSVILKKRLTYAVTPKGDQQTSSVPLTMFLPHFILGTITGIDAILSFTTPHHSALLFFWAVMNTVTMYGFIAYEAWQRAISKLSRRQLVLTTDTA